MHSSLLRFSPTPPPPPLQYCFRIFIMSRIFHAWQMVSHFSVLQFHVLQFQWLTSCTQCCCSGCVVVLSWRHSDHQSSRSAAAAAAGAAAASPPASHKHADDRRVDIFTFNSRYVYGPAAFTASSSSVYGFQVSNELPSLCIKVQSSRQFSF